MEANRKGEGFWKRKRVMSLCRPAAKGGGAPSASTAAKYSGGKVKSSPSASSSTASVDFILYRDYVTPQPNQTVLSFAPPPENGRVDAYSNFETLHGVGAAEESVDLKAASYISRVQERFRLECGGIIID